MPETLPLPEELYQAGPVVCRQCRREIEPFVIVVITGIRMLRCGTALVQETTLNCIHCGWEFQWKPDRRRRNAETAIQVGRAVLEIEAMAGTIREKEHSAFKNNIQARKEA